MSPRLNSSTGPSLRRSLWFGSVGFCGVSLLVFGSWAVAGRWLFGHLGELGAYAVWAVLFMLAGGAVFSCLMSGPGRVGRFFAIFTVAFLGYAAVWTGTWFLFRNQLGEWLASLSATATMGLILCASFNAWKPGLRIVSALFVAHSLGYFLGEAGYSTFGGMTGQLFWGAAYGLGFGLGLGYALYRCQEQARPALDSVAGGGGQVPAGRTPAPESGYGCFDELIARLRSEGYTATAQRLDDLLHQTAWTTGSELIGELGLEIIAFERANGSTATAELRQSVDTCLAVVRRHWPDISR